MGLLDGLSAEAPMDKVNSITTGIVKENWDKDHPGMIKVELFLGEQGKNVTGWVPIATPYGGKAHGLYMLPEVGSEVVVGFNMGDRNCPIVIGCLWNHVNTLPPDTANKKNSIKRFKTKGGCEVVFEEEEKKEKIKISTPGELSIQLDDEKKAITVIDKDGKNGITIDCGKGAVTVLADKKMEFSVGGEIMMSLDGGSKTTTLKSNNIKLQAKQGLELKGQSLKAEGSMTELKGKSTLKIESSAIAEIKGAMVKIN